ncbi:hypothetical protein SLE2022_365150 [Rubroshorea leprosula]
MAPSKVACYLVFALSSCILLCNAQILHPCEFDAIYQLGDSISDTGNLIRQNPSSVYAKPPYGQTYGNGKPTGRCSDGLLMIDFFAQSAGIPFLEPYLKIKKGASNTGANGVNFAVAGSTALSARVLATKGILNPLTVTSLSEQLDWMETYFRALCSGDKDKCSEKLKTALFLVGEIGGNDYNYAFLEGKTIAQIKAMVPEIVQAIKTAVSRVIGFGATRVVVPGNFPIGCIPIYLTSYKTKNSSAYDELHCLKSLNDVSTYHNNILQQAIKDLRKENPNVVVVYGDYFNAYLWIVRNAERLGFDAESVQKSCCGNGGDYNFSITSMCGAPGVPVCANPNQHLSWDGIHSTQQAYKYMADWLLRDIVSELKCKTA